jgi:hypothetical protein
MVVSGAGMVVSSVGTVVSGAKVVVSGTEVVDGDEVEMLGSAVTSGSFGESIRQQVTKPPTAKRSVRANAMIFLVRSIVAFSFAF